MSLQPILTAGRAMIIAGVALSLIACGTERAEEKASKLTDEGVVKPLNRASKSLQWDDYQKHRKNDQASAERRAQGFETRIYANTTTLAASRDAQTVHEERIRWLESVNDDFKTRLRTINDAQAEIKKQIEAQRAAKRVAQKRRAQKKVISPKAPQLVSIEVWGDDPSAVIRENGISHPLGIEENLGAWTVRRIDQQSGIVVLAHRQGKEVELTVKR